MSEKHRAGWHVTGREPREIVSWRVRRLVAAGFTRPEAVTLAHNPEVDLHAILDLIARGCPPELAARIVAPL
jgi:hypothetical protein